MNQFLQSWAESSLTSIGLFWMALWAFALGYLISSLIQVVVTHERMQETMGETGIKSVVIGTFFGFISSSCSFAALSTTRALFQRGAGLVPSLAFMLASTNLVIELGIVIAIFLGWQFVVGEYVGGLLLIGFAWLFVVLTRPIKMVKAAREHLGANLDHGTVASSSWTEKLASRKGWQQIGMKYVMEWRMVWKDVLIGFTVAGIISAFVPNAFFQTLFIGSGGRYAQDPGFIEVFAQTLIGPIAAFCTFIGSMGNIPLAAILFDHGVSLAGVMAFIFSDLVVFPILRINARYYGWRMAWYLMALLLTCLVAASLVLHYGFAAFDLLPDTRSAETINERALFKLNYGFVLNLIFLAMSGILGLLWRQGRAEKQHSHDHDGNETSTGDRVLKGITVIAILWLIGGVVIKVFSVGSS
ncbi:permease [Methylomarinum vadi]|uniref:permease n=1 Tax=Methylomarinum vadi TaxID=438855 RepID=UPI0004DF24C6|nr:permease [Methylomarinum vadi]